MAKSKPVRKAPVKAAKPKSEGAPSIDTTAAVETAAALISKKVPTGIAEQSPRKESHAFKQLKEGLNPTGGGAIGNVLDKTGGSSGKRSSVPFGHEGNRQVGHNQTFGADVNRAGLPRRTGG
jgi:hypothetical protein